MPREAAEKSLFLVLIGIVAVGWLFSGNDDQEPRPRAQRAISPPQLLEPAIGIARGLEGSTKQIMLVTMASQIQLDPTQPGLPIKPGRLGTMTHDYTGCRQPLSLSRPDAHGGANRGGRVLQPRTVT